MYMKTKKRASRPRPAIEAKRKMVNGKPMVMLKEADFDRLLDVADLFEPTMPEPNADGTYPALATIRADLARRIVRHRRKAGLTQADLAQRAGIRPEFLNRIEHGHVDPGVRTIEKIDKVLCDLVGECDD